MNAAVLYVRVSSAEQEKEGYSLDAQEKMGVEYARRKGMDIVRVWKISESAWRSERTAFNQMVEFVKKRPDVGHIIFDVTDRMTRNDFDKLKIYGLIREHGKSVHFSRTNKIFNRDSGSDDEFMFDIEVAVAKKMSNDISRKSQMGMLEKAEQGCFPSVAPLGYRNNPLTHMVDVDDERAGHIRRAFELMSTGTYSLITLGVLLTAEGFRNRGGGTVGKSTLAFILKNPFYHGVFVWKGKTYDGKQTPLISRDLFGCVQSVLTGKYHPRQSKKNFHFNGLAVCGICGCKVIGERKKGIYDYYHCTFTKGRHDGRAYLRSEDIAAKMGEAVKRVTLPTDIADWLVEALREKTKNASAFQENRFNALKADMEKAETRLSRLYDAKFDGSLPDEVFHAKGTEYQAQIAALRGQMRVGKRGKPGERGKWFTNPRTFKELVFSIRSGGQRRQGHYLAIHSLELHSHT
jgi:site-specific DNA recombinase